MTDQRRVDHRSRPVCRCRPPDGGGVSRWLKEDDDFRAIYDGWRDQILTMTAGQLAALAESAVATLTHAIRDRRDVRATQFVIKHLSAADKRK
jgi:hypothetical protein